jgi:acyl-CoA synthetase (AMP-forming)/AMP-acid ligase II
LWANVPLSVELARSATAHPHATLSVHSRTHSGSITLGKLHEQGIALAGALYKLGLRAGDVIAVQAPNWLETVLLYRASAACGCVTLPISPSCGWAETAHMLCDAKARAWVMPDRWGNFDSRELLGHVNAPCLERVIVIGQVSQADATAWNALLAMAGSDFPAHRRSADDATLLLYTSGTTAAPKGVIHSSNSVIAEMRSSQMVRVRPKAATLSPWPAGHVAGFLGVLRHAIDGADTVLMDHWSAADAAGLIERHRIELASGTPHHLSTLLDAAQTNGISLGSMKEFLVGGTTVAPALVERCDRLGLATYRAYGLSEHPTVSQGSADDPVHARVHTDGTLSPGSEVRILDESVDDVGSNTEAAIVAGSNTEGEIVTRGPERFIGYTDAALNRDTFLPGGWFRTGDIGRLDGTGFLTITDRKKDIIIRGGKNISSRAVEELLLLHPAVAEVAVVAAPDARLGERVCAFVVARENAAPALSLETPGSWFASAGASKHQAPERLELVAELPRTSSGKVRKADLRARLRDS